MGAIKGDTRSLDYSSYGLGSRLLGWSTNLEQPL